MTVISANELREKSVDELKQTLLSSLDEQFKLRMQASSSEQQIQPHLVKEARRNVARIKTVLSEKHLDEKKSLPTVNVKEGG